MSEMISIMRTGHLYRLDMADSSLSEAGIPHYLREESASGMRLAMSAAPSMEPGVWWAILVPEERVSEARAVLESLPFETTTTPGIWDCQAAGASGRFAVWYRVFATALLAWILYSMGAALVRTF